MILNDLTSAELVAAVAPHGVPAAVARRLFARVHDPGSFDFAAVRGLSHAAAAALTAAGAGPRRIEVASRRRSAADGFVKYLFRLHDGALVEAVLIPLPAGPDTIPEKHVLCLSSQAGCALACVFCATGRLGPIRDLAAWEIVEQVARVSEEATAPIRGLVFMGMGEPFLNYDAVIRAARILSDPAGFAIAARAITISTAGIVPAIRRYTAEGHKFRLAISLTAGTAEKRRALMPIERKYPIEELIAAVREHAARTRDRVMLEYVAISGVNCGPEDAAALASLLAGIRIRFNLIEVNDHTGRLQPPSTDELAAFVSALQVLRQPIVRRYSGGKDVRAACGMLAATR